MRHSFFLLILVVVISCNQRDSKNNTTTTDSNTHKPSADTLPQTRPQATADSSLLTISDSVLSAIKASDYARLGRYIHPLRGLRFSPYAYIDTGLHRVFFDRHLIEAAKTKEKINWGVFDGSGDPIILTLADYFKRFVYDADYLHPNQRSINQFIGAGNSLNNLKQVYPGCDFTEYYFPGFDPKYEGMDWRTLRLVFKKEGTTVYLVGIVHDEWTS